MSKVTTTTMEASAKPDLIKDGALQTSNRRDDIKCPFLRMTEPDTSNVYTFIDSLHTKGNISVALSLYTWFKVSNGQGKNTLLAALGSHDEMLDLYRLDQVHGISHNDLFNSYPEQVKEQLLDAADDNDNVTLHDLVLVKKWICRQVGVTVETMKKSSKYETGLIFLASGGDLETFTVNRANLIGLLLYAQRPKLGEIPEVSFPRLQKVVDEMDWS